MKTWIEKAPANIALIKYMGKVESKNLPLNPSLSYTLDHLITTVELQTIPGFVDQWEPLVSSPTDPELSLSEESVNRFLKHLDRLKQRFDYTGSFLVRSHNNFPQSAGIASSASSFAALTKCAASALSELTTRSPLSILDQAQLSRLGSGSSCRSFYGPWCVWDQENVFEVKLAYPTLIHQVVLVEKGSKSVSSSEAHRRVTTSPLFPTRAARAKGRLDLLMNGFEKQNWKQIHDLCWDEFWDMHQLFETADEPFTYMTLAVHQILAMISDLWKEKQDGPVVTMDAGSTIHLLYRPDQKDLAESLKTTLLKDYVVL